MKRRSAWLSLVLASCGAAALVSGVALVAPSVARAAEEDPFAVPDGDFKVLQKFIEKVASTEPKGETLDERRAFSVKALTALVGATDKLLTMKLSDEQTGFAREYQLAALQGLVQMGEEGAGERLDKVIAEVRVDKRERIAALGWDAFLSPRLSEWDSLDAAARDDVRSQVLAAVKDGQPGKLDVMIVQSVAGALSHGDNEFVRDLLAEALPVLRESKSKAVREALASSQLEGINRLMNLLGNPIKVTGTLLDGEPVDWESYRGKVVLVDFWATWCGPCRAEIPNVLAMYKAYHDKGFDVLGVSLDDTPKAAHKYISENGIPWPSLFSSKEDQRGWDAPLARYYGITGIPTALLVDQKGNVVHMNARGPELRKALQQLLGDPAESTDDANARKADADKVGAR